MLIFEWRIVEFCSGVLRLAVMDYEQRSVDIRTKSGGQIYTGLKAELSTQEDLATYYSPGIAGPCRVIATDPQRSKELTQRRNTVAVISDGSAVLGLGNIGPTAALPVMEGKCMLLKHFADVDGVPIVLDTQDTDEIIETITRLAPSFGGINLEDIAAPRCFEIEAALSERLDIPVFHDDQHGTAIVVLAALENALKVVGKDKTKIKVVIVGAGAAGIAIAQLLSDWGVVNLTLVDSKGVVSCDRADLHQSKLNFCSVKTGDLESALIGSDVFVGVSKPELLNTEMIQAMAEKAIIFALSNPNPEIRPETALAAGAAVVATGRSDYPNQINNVLVFPGIFRGLLDAGATTVNTQIKLAAAAALAGLVTNPTTDKIVPSPLQAGVSDVIATAVAQNV